MTAKEIKNIVFWGEDTFSNVVLISLIQAGYNVQLVISPLYDNLIYKRLELTCTKNNIEFIREKAINSGKVFDTLKLLAPDLCVICHFERIIKQPILSVPKYGFINVHPSMLPYYRGLAPQHWPIINGEKEVGITCHYVDEFTDTGNIIIQKSFILSENMYVSDLQRLWIIEYSKIVVEAIDHIKRDEATREQRNLKGSFYGKLKEEQCIINSNGTVREAYNLVRGVSLPYYGASYADIIIFKSHIMKNGENTEDKVTIKFKDGILVIDQYKNKNTMKAKVLEILANLVPEYDFNEEVNFIEHGMLDSFDIVTLVSDLDSTFGISIDGVDIIPENFATVDSIVNLLKKNGVQ